MEQIRSWGKKVVIVLNKIDMFQEEDDRKMVERFIAENAHTLFGFTPEIFPVSARQALQAKLGNPSMWEPSRFEQLEAYIHDTLDETGRLRLKFLNPLGVGMHLVEKYLDVTASRLELLADDFTTLNDVDSQLAVYKEDMRRGDFRMSILRRCFRDGAGL
jgi:hypothetical protein